MARLPAGSYVERVDTSLVVVPAVWVTVRHGSARACRLVVPVAFSTTRWLGCQSVGSGAGLLSPPLGTLSIAKTGQ